MKILRAFAILLLFVTLAAIHLAITTSSIKIGYEIDALKEKLKAIRSQNRYLNYLVARDESLSRIDQISSGRLGMFYPEKMNYVIIGTKESD